MLRRRMNGVAMLTLAAGFLFCARYGYSDEIPGKDNERGAVSVSKAEDVENPDKISEEKKGGQDDATKTSDSGYTEGPAWQVLGQSGRKLTEPDGRKDIIGLNRNVYFNCDTSEAYNDNIFLASRGTKRRCDFITTISPRMSFAYLKDDNFFYASYGAQQLLYAINGNNKVNRVNQDVEVVLDLFKSSAVKTTIRNTAQRTTTAASAETNNFVKRVCNEFNYRLKFDFSPKSAIALEYDNNLQNYLGSQFEQNSYVDNTLSPIFYWYMSPKTILSAQYDFATTSAYNYSDSNSMSDQIRFGIEEKITPKLLLKLKGGYQCRIFTHSDQKNSSLPVGSGSIDYQYSENISFHTVALYGTEHSIATSSGYMKIFNLGSYFQWHLFGNTNASLGGFYIWNCYPSYAVRTYSIFSRIEYKIRQWLSAYIEYDYRTASATINQPQATNNIATWGFKADF